MRLLDACCCEGGASKGYDDAGFDVFGVDIFEDYSQKRYPYPSHKGDAVEFIRAHGHEFDVIHASPPCQHASTGTRALRKSGREYPRLIEPIREALIATGKPYVIENVRGADLIDPIELCGCMFDLTAVDTDGILLHLQRARRFESNLPLSAPRPCDHSDHEWVGGSYGGARRGQVRGEVRAARRLRPVDPGAARAPGHRLDDAGRHVPEHPPRLHGAPGSSDPGAPRTGARRVTAPTFADLQFPRRPEWSGIGAVNWDGVQGPDDLMLTSGSSVGDALKADALERWALNTTIERIAERNAEFMARWQQDPEEALEWAGQLRYERAADGTLSATDTGTLLHSLWESWVTGMDLPAEDQAAIKADPVITAMATRMWEVYHRFQPRAVAVEQVVFDPAYGFAGRLDCALTFDKAPQLGTQLVDIKTTREARYEGGGKKRPFGDHALQLSPYFHAPLWATFEPRLRVSSRKTDTRIYLLNPAEAAACRPAPAMAGALILHVTPEAAAFYPIEVGPSVHRRAVEAAGCLRWLKDESKRVIGYPLAPPIDLPDLTT